MVINSYGKSPFEIRDFANKEFKEIYDNQGRLLFKNWNEIQGSLPLQFKSYADCLKDCRIYGNTVQNGTPSPEAPVDVVGCGAWDETQQSYKLPLTVNGTEYPIYLGQVETTRKVKKLVLTGKETITKAASNPVFTMQLSGSNTPLSENAVTTLSTHYQAQNNVAGTGNVNDMRVCIRRGYGAMYIGDTRYGNITDFKSYLAAQYAAGTPVTVWYVLAEPETAIVNEPIQKIGDYSDELSIADIPTINGINTISADTTVQPSEIYIKGKIKSLATHTLIDSNNQILISSDNHQLVTKEQQI